MNSFSCFILQTICITTLKFKETKKLFLIMGILLLQHDYAENHDAE